MGNVQALAEDFMVGTVFSTNLDKREIVVVPLEKGDATDVTKSKDGIVARLSDDALVVNRMGRHVYPGCVSPGGIIRLWGRMDEKEKVFYAAELRCWGGGGGHDPTGVRRRLHRRRGWNCPGGPTFHGGR